MLRQQILTETAGATASLGDVWTPPPDYKAHIAVTESLTSVDTDTEPETDLKLETISQSLTDSDTISINLADASDDTPETVKSIDTATADGDTVSIKLGESAATESAAASDTVDLATTAAPPASVSAPVGVPSAATHSLYASHPPPPPPLPVVVNSDSEGEMAEAQSNT